VRLLQLEGEVQELVRTGRISAGHGRALQPLRGHVQVGAAREIVNRSLTVRETERLVKRRLGTKQNRRPSRPVALGAFESRLRDHLEAKVTIRGTERSGRIVIEYRGGEDLSRLLGRLLGNEP